MKKLKITVCLEDAEVRCLANNSIERVINEALRTTRNETVKSDLLKLKSTVCKLWYAGSSEALVEGK